MQDPTALLAGTRVVPVIRIDAIDDALPLAEALVRGGLRVLEITLRTPVALDAIRLVAERLPEAVVGAGTLRSAGPLPALEDAGARFVVSPGTTPALLEALESSPLPALPGVGTVSEAMALSERGFPLLKLFPAEAIGGVSLLQAIAAPLPELRFCPTGGIGPRNAPGYLALPNVACVGGSWMLPRDAVADRRWDEIEKLAREAATL